MKVVERFLCGKAEARQPCEDAIFINDAFAAVIDGATAKDGRRFGEGSSGLFAARSILASLAGLDPGAAIRDFVAHVSEALARDIAREAPGFDLRGGDGPSATVVAWSAARREVWRVGDASWATPGTSNPGRKAIDDVAAHARAAFLRARLLRGDVVDMLARDDPGRTLVLPLLSIQHVFRNLDDPDEPLAFGAIDGTPVPERFQECWHVPDADELVLASDGYPAVLPTLDEAEAHLAATLARDPLRIGAMPSTKGVVPGTDSFDDRAYLRIATRA